MNGVQYPLFISAPQGSQQVPLRAVPGEAVDDCFRWKIPQAQLQNGNIFLQFQRLHPACLPLRCQIRVPEDVEQMIEYAPAKIIISRDSFADDTAMANAYYILRDHGIELKLI